MTIRQTSRTLLALAASLFIAACGGGGGGNGDGGDNDGSDGDEMTSTNAATVTRSAYTAGSGIATSALTQTNSEISAVTVDGDGETELGSAAAVTDWVIRQLDEGITGEDNGDDAILGVNVDSGNCPDGGTFSVSQSEGSTNDQLDEGDSFSVQFTNCAFSTLLLDGGFSFEVLSVTPPVGDPNVDWGYEVELSYDAWSITGDGLDLFIDGDLVLGLAYDNGNNEFESTMTGGPLTFETGDESFTMRDIDIALTSPATSGGGPSATNFELSINYQTDIDTPDYSGTVTVDTSDSNPLADTNSDGLPDQGEMTISDSNGNEAQIDAGECGDDEYQLTFTDSGGAITSDCEPWQPSS